MRAGDPGFEVSPDGAGGTWRIGRAPDQAWPKKGWGTDFSCFRMAVPRLAGFAGTHVYLDADMLVRADVGELLGLPRIRPFTCLSLARTDVSVVDASQIAPESWPTMPELRQSGYRMFEWTGWLAERDLVSPTLPPEWNVCDTHVVGVPDPGTCRAKLLHYTTVPTQPYRPYPNVRYAPHPWASWSDAWAREHAEALEARS
jgi:hypothetical protein